MCVWEGRQCGGVNMDTVCTCLSVGVGLWDGCKLLAPTQPWPSEGISNELLSLLISSLDY